MKVKELMAKLKAHNPEAKVYIVGTCLAVKDGKEKRKM